MSDRQQHINELLQRAANDLTVPTPVANLFMLVGAEFLQLSKHIETLSNQNERHTNQINELRKQIERLKGVHGA